MTETKRKFGALAELRRPETAAPNPPLPEIPDPPPAPPILGAGKGRRPVGKRSDPEWKLFSHFLKKKTQREAAALLLAEGENSPDLSDVLQNLLEGWIAEQKKR